MVCSKNPESKNVKLYEVIQVALCFCGVFLIYFMTKAIYVKYKLNAIRKNIRICFNKTPWKKSINFSDSCAEV